MEQFELVIGNKNYSSWSLRPWLLMRQAGIPFDEILIPLREPGSLEERLRHSPTGMVPLLKHGQLSIWESLAIAEYIAELYPEKKLWPIVPPALWHALFPTKCMPVFWPCANSSR